MSQDREPVIVVINNGFERRYFYSARQAMRGLGWLVWEPHHGIEAGEVQVYRLDEEATDTLNAELRRVPRDLDSTGSFRPGGGWLKSTATKFQTIIQNCTGIKEK